MKKPTMMLSCLSVYIQLRCNLSQPEPISLQPNWAGNSPLPPQRTYYLQPGSHPNVRHLSTHMPVLTAWINWNSEERISCNITSYGWIILL